MASVRQNRLRPSGASGSYIEAMHSILAHAGWIDCSPSTPCFRFTVNRRLTGESAAAYNWMAELFVAGDFIGVTTSQHAGFSFEASREESVMSYDEFGRNESPYWYVQIFESQVAADAIDVYKESLI